MTFPKPTIEDWTQWVEMLSQGKPDLGLVAAICGVEREVLVHAWRTGWPGHRKTGKGAYPPIKDIVEQMEIAAIAQRAALDERLNEEQKRAIDEAIRDGATRKAMEGLVSQTFLRAIDKHMQGAVRLMNASQPIVDLLVSQMQTMAESKKVTMAEARGAISFVTGYVREAGVMMQAYAKIEESRAARLPSKVSGVPEEAKSPDKLVDELVGLFKGMKSILGGTPKVIDVKPSQASSSSSSSSSQTS